MSFQLQTMRLVIPGVFFLTFGQIGSGALESNSMRKEGLCTKTSPQLPFDQGVQIHIQRVLALCEFHYCDFSKLSMNIWLMQLLAILFHYCDLAYAIFG